MSIVLNATQLFEAQDLANHLRGSESLRGLSPALNIRFLPKHCRTALVA